MAEEILDKRLRQQPNKLKSTKLGVRQRTEGVNRAETLYGEQRGLTVVEWAVSVCVCVLGASSSTTHVERVAWPYTECHSEDTESTEVKGPVQVA